MKCPKCGIENPADERICDCGHLLSKKLLTPAASPEPFQPVHRQAAEAIVSALHESGQSLRKCAKCDSVMPMFLCENMRINGLIPSGKRMHFRCVSCGKEIKLRSAWRLFLVTLGIPFFVLVAWALYPFQSYWALGFVLLMAAYPLVLVFEVATRFRYQGIGNGD